ncbi:MAG: glycosyltransferase [Flavobacterium sp.]|nr:MAG: glycosyltransferase [Flavobacterium sp.]
MNQNSIKFSVLLPVYIKDNPLFFSEAINSILNQSIVPNEIVIVKDGPICNEINELILKLALKMPKMFTIIELENNMGMGYAMNKGLHACKYDWVARMDSDDISRKNRFQTQVEYILSHPTIDVIGGQIEEFNTSPGDLKQLRKLPKEHAAIKSFSKRRNPMNHMTVFFKKSKAIEVGGYWHQRILEDYHLWYQMLSINCAFINLDTVLVDARIGNNMIGRRNSFSYFKIEFYLFKKMFDTGYINLLELLSAIIERFIMKLIPLKMLQYLYKNYLRK